MSESATKALRRMLNELGVPVVDNMFGITWDYYSNPHTATESMDGTLIVSGLTPEQAIAATLGERHPYVQRITGDGSDWGEIMTDAFDSIMASASESCTPDEMRALESHIAATLGVGECEQVIADYYDGLMPPFTVHCSKCGAEWGFTPKFCPECGAKVTGTRDERKAVKR